jgi:hypothetical protein
MDVLRMAGFVGLSTSDRILTSFVFTGISDTLAEVRSLPTPSGVSAARADSIGFFGKNRQVVFRENLLLRFELYSGDTAFKPPNFLLPITPALRGYPETLPSCHSDIKQHSCGNETQGDH